ncbi:hypothetical protein OROHE_004561 [Orobanche hederae]
MLMELLRREKNAGINPDQDLDILPSSVGTADKCSSGIHHEGISLSWQILLLRRNSPGPPNYFDHDDSVFFRMTMHHNTLDDGGIYLGALYFAIVMILFNGFMEVPMLIAKLPVFYKHRDLHFYPCWVYTLPSWFLSIPLSLVGFDSQITRTCINLRYSCCTDASSSFCYISL